MISIRRAKVEEASILTNIAIDSEAFRIMMKSIWRVLKTLMV
ncbi:MULTISPECIES: hypothetical protein [unclassified Clostridium]